MHIIAKHTNSALNIENHLFFNGPSDFLYKYQANTSRISAPLSTAVYCIEVSRQIWWAPWKGKKNRRNRTKMKLYSQALLNRITLSLYTFHHASSLLPATGVHSSGYFFIRFNLFFETVAETPFLLLLFTFVTDAKLLKNYQ